uniref:Cytochrome P450 84A1 n=1 Tax=Cajanus cajan TaxID=3821 RepID=A0A151UA46_CAJCA|nr:Cytochrome P450 84A1 [Cajanus cajan]
MALLSIIPLIMLLLVSLSLLRRTKPYPPGPKALPIIANMLIMKHLTHKGLAHLANKYGGVFHLRMGFLHMVAISNTNMARQVLQVQDNIFSNRPATIAIRYLTYDRTDMSFAHYGSTWRCMRKLCVVKLLSRHRIESWRCVRDEVRNVVCALGYRTGESVNIRDTVFNLTKNIVYRAAFGSRLEEGENEFFRILQEFSKLFGAFNVADFLPFLAWLDPHGFNARLAKARAALDAFIDIIIHQHVRKKSAVQENDIVHQMLDLQLDQTHHSGRFTKDNIRGLIMDVMFGGTETVALAIEWVMAEPMRNPSDMKLVQEELAHVVGLHRHVEDSDIDHLSHLKCAIKETLRLHPPTPLHLHETAEDATFAGYFIPKKSRVLINTWAIAVPRKRVMFPL